MSTCGLCEIERELVSSHLIGAAAYKTLRDPELKNPNPIVISSDLARTTSEQVQKPFLCSECEQTFSEKGERVVLGQCVRDEGFPLKERLRDQKPLVADESIAAFDLRSTYGDDADSFVYFPMSVFWRASTTRWTDGNKKIKHNSLGPYQEEFQRYLVGEIDIPKKVALVMQVAADKPNRSVAFPSSANQHGYRMHQFYIPGILYTAFVGKRIPKALKEFSMNQGDIVLALAGELSTARIFQNVRKLAKEVRFSKKLKARSSKDA